MQTSRLVVQRLSTNTAPLTSFFTHQAAHQRRACLSRSSCSIPHAATVTSAWLDQAVQQNTQNSSTSNSIAFLTSIIRQADSLQHPRRHWQGAGDSTATSGVVLRELHFQVPAEFAVPAQTTVPVHQLVSVFSALLSAPRNFHKDARALTRGMGAKWSLLRLLLRRARSPPEVFEACLNEVLQAALEGPARKLKKVLDNPLVPEVNKQQAQQQLDRLWALCHSHISTWAAEACSSANFAMLQPVMVALEDSLNVSVLGLNQELLQALSSELEGVEQLARCSIDAGKIMEAAARQAVIKALPDGWTLLTSLHLLGVDGQVLTDQKGCKYEVDMLVLDERGVAVAIIEVKLGAANPLMSLVNDVCGLLKLLDRTAGRTLTCLTKDGAAAAAARAASASAAAGSSGGIRQPAPTPDPDLQRTLSNMTARPQFAASSEWQILHVPVHRAILPVYVLGNDISQAAVRRGLNSLVSSSALNMLGKSAEALATALAGNVQRWEESIASNDSEGANAAVSVQSYSPQYPDWPSLSDGEEYSVLHSSSSSSSSSSSIDSGSSSNCEGEELESLSEQVSSSSGSGQVAALFAQAMQDGANGLNACRARLRASLQLDEQQQQLLTESTLKKIATMQQRCRFYSLGQPVQ